MCGNEGGDEVVMREMITGMRMKGGKIGGRALLIILLASLMSTVSTLAQPSPYFINGYVFHANGTACDAPLVKITNENTGAHWTAETSQNMYGCIIANGMDVNVSETLQIYAWKDVQSKIIHHTVTENETEDGILCMNITLLNPPETPFVVQGAVFYETGEPCINLTGVTITNKNTGNTWNAEIHEGFNQYMLVISDNVSEGDVLEINATDGSSCNSTTHAVSSGEIDSGIVSHNVTLPALNMAPSVDSILITPDDDVEEGVQIDPQPGENKTVNISAVVSDMNGYDDISSVIATITGQSDVADSPVILHFVSNIDGNTAIFNGSFNMSFYYESGIYTVTVNATDKSGATGTNTSSFNYREAIALRMDAVSISFGSVDPGEYCEVSGDHDFATTDKPTIQNIGNTVINVKISGTNLTSEENAVIEKRNIRARVDALSYKNLSEERVFDVQMPIGNAVFENIDFNLSVERGTPPGNYEGNVTITAVSV